MKSLALLIIVILPSCIASARDSSAAVGVLIRNSGVQITVAFPDGKFIHLSAVPDRDIEDALSKIFSLPGVDRRKAVAVQPTQSTSKERLDLILSKCDKMSGRRASLVTTKTFPDPLAAYLILIPEVEEDELFSGLRKWTVFGFINGRLRHFDGDGANVEEMAMQILHSLETDSLEGLDAYQGRVLLPATIGGHKATMKIGGELKEYFPVEVPKGAIVLEITPANRARGKVKLKEFEAAGVKVEQLSELPELRNRELRLLLSASSTASTGSGDLELRFNGKRLSLDKIGGNANTIADKLARDVYTSLGYSAWTIALSNTESVVLISSRIYGSPMSLEKFEVNVPNMKGRRWTNKEFDDYLTKDSSLSGR